MAELGDPLSDRELDVLQCLAKGATNKEIAADLSISQNTVKVHLRNIYAKLGTSSRTEATTAAIQQGIITVPGLTPEPPVEDAPAPEPEPTASTAVPEPIASPAPSAEVAPEPVAPPPTRRNPRVLLLAGLLLVAVVAIGFLGWQVAQQSNSTASAEPYEEVAIDDTRWFVSRPMPDARSGMAATAIGLDVYQIGGETADGVDGRVRAFDSNQREWRDVAPKPTAVTHAAAAELFGEIYVVGGEGEDGLPTAVVEAYSPSQDAWRPIAALPEPRAGGLALTDGAFLYLFGGFDGEQTHATAYIYDPAANSWRPLPDLPEPRAFATGGAVATQLYVVGGTAGESASDSCFVFDPDTEGWHECPPMLAPRVGAGAAVVLNKLYVIGGGMAADDPAAYGEVYDPNTETWQLVNIPAADETAGGWSNSAVSHIETRIFVQGGRSGEELLDSNLVYAPLVYQTFLPATTSEE